MPAGKVSKRGKRPSHVKHARPSRRQADDDMSKIQSLDHTIQEHQKAKFYGISDAQLDYQASRKTETSRDRSLRGLENLVNAHRPAKLQHETTVPRDLRALDGVLQGLSQMEFSPSQKVNEKPHHSLADDTEIDV